MMFGTKMGSICTGLLVAFLLSLMGSAGQSHSLFQSVKTDLLSAKFSISIFQDQEGRMVRIKWKNLKHGMASDVELDDAPYFRHPMMVQNVRGGKLNIDALKIGLSPGIPYYLRISPPGVSVRFRLHGRKRKVNFSMADYLSQGWKTTGREWLFRYSGVKWNDVLDKWQIDPNWPALSTVAVQAYDIEYPAEIGVNLAFLNHDLEIANDLADFYLAYRQRFTTLGEMRSRKSASIATDLLDNNGADAVVTLGWLGPGNPKKEMQECFLCNSQFFYPVARLIRFISSLPIQERTPVMKEFTAAYLPIIVKDHLLRLAYEAKWNYWNATELPPHLIQIWKYIMDAPAQPKFSYQHAMQDWDLWIIATSAEMLGASANDPDRVPLTKEEEERLREIVHVGISLFQKKRTLYSDTRDFTGKPVNSASYFNGDFDDHPEMSYAEYTASDFPPVDKKYPARNGSWDISHFYRVPIFLRSLYDNRKITGDAFPQTADIQLVVNQYLYKVFNGDFCRPLFKNFFNGSDGWYNVGSNGPSFGFPPSVDCDMQDPNRPCLTVAGIYGWGLLSSFNGDMETLQQSLFDLATSHAPETIRFRDRYYYYGRSFSFEDEKGKPQYPFALLRILSEIPLNSYE